MQEAEAERWRAIEEFVYSLGVDDIVEGTYFVDDYLRRTGLWPDEDEVRSHLEEG